MDERQRKSFSAAKKVITPHVRITSICGDTAAKDAPSSMLARRASFTAVSGSILMNGCTTFGKLDDEKKTPEKIHIGSMMKFMIPETASVVRAREAVSRPNPPNEIAPSRQMSNNVPTDPRNGTPKAQCPNPTSVNTSRIRNTSREHMNERRYCTRDIGVAISRLSSFLLRAVTMANPS